MEVAVAVKDAALQTLKEKINAKEFGVFGFLVKGVVHAASVATNVAPKSKIKKVDTTSKGGRRTIEYYFDTTSYDTIIEYRLRLAMNKIEQASCVKFEGIPSQSERTGPTKTLIYVTNPNNQRECNHEPYYNRFENLIKLVLGLDCLQEREVLHSLLHALGFNDEVTHPQREKYVRVMWNNIQPKYRKLFRTQVNTHLAATPVEYDPLSIMHFHARAYSSNGHPTILPVISGLAIYPSNDLSMLDKMKLRLQFGQNCNTRKLNELMDSCKLSMTSEKTKGGVKDDDANEPGDEQDEGSDGEIDAGKKNSATPDKPLDDNMSSSGPEIVAG